MIATLRERLDESFRSFAQIFRNPDIRKLELGWAVSVLGHWAYGIALAVYAYDKGGAAAVGLVGLIRFLPPAIVGPFTAMLADRYRRELVIVHANLVRAVLLGLAAVVMAVDGPPAVVYILAGLVAVAFSAIRPAQAALLPGAGQDSLGAHGGERRHQHDRGSRRLRRPGARRDPADGDECLGRLRGGRCRVPLLGDRGVADQPAADA